MGALPADRNVAPEDVAKTVYHAMGIRDPEATDRGGGPFALMPDGEAMLGLF